jgi:hypothetical protein
VQTFCDNVMFLEWLLLMVKQCKIDSSFSPSSQKTGTENSNSTVSAVYCDTRYDLITSVCAIRLFLNIDVFSKPSDSTKHLETGETGIKLKQIKTK